MAKYKCQNCNNVWHSNEEPFECPACSGTDFEKIGGNSPKWLKWAGIAAAGIVALIVLFVLIDGPDTTVTTNADQTRCKLTVSIAGDHSKEYKIILRKDGAVYGEANKKESATFSDLEGTYTLDIQFIGKGNLPKINNYQKTFTFTKPPQAPEVPQITSVTPNPPKLSRSVKVYTVTITTDVSIVPLNETEFSANGTNWQSSNTFNNVQAGTYTFYARNIRDNSLQDSKTLVLEPFVPMPLPTVVQLNGLLNGIAGRNQTDSDKFIEILGSNTTVKGVSNVSTVADLANEAYIQKSTFQVTNIEVVNDVVVSITVR